MLLITATMTLWVLITNIVFTFADIKKSQGEPSDELTSKLLNGFTLVEVVTDNDTEISDLKAILDNLKRFLNGVQEEPLQGNYNNTQTHHSNDNHLIDDTIYYNQVEQHKESLKANTKLMNKLTKELKDKRNKRE